MLSPFAAASQSLQGQPSGMPGMGAPGMGAMQGPPSIGGMPQNPLAALGGLGGMLAQNPNEQILLSMGSFGYPMAGGSSSMNQGGMVMDPIMRDQLQGMPSNETLLQFSPNTYRPDGPFSQQSPGLSLAAQLQQAPPAGSMGQQLPQAPRGTMGGGVLPSGGGSSPLLQALGGR